MGASLAFSPRPPLQRVVVPATHALNDYAAVAQLAPAVAELHLEAAGVVPRLAGRTVWMVSSTAQGGGVAEMLPTIVSLLRDLGVQVEWLVIHADDPAFFELTKRIHNLIHGVGPPELSHTDRALYERVTQENADSLRQLVKPGDILVVHDPQPLPIASQLRTLIPLLTIWRCHIGLDAENDATRAAWKFLDPYLDAYDAAVFSAPEYIPTRLARRASVVFPGIDPLTAKNRDLSLRRTVEIMCSGGLIPCPGPSVPGSFSGQVQRVNPDGSISRASAENLGLLTRPIVTQISRWDRLKGFAPLMEGFAELKRTTDRTPRDGGHQRRRELVRLVLAVPEPAAIQQDIALLLLPMGSLEENALLVNALQRASTVVVQNSLREGFGLTIAEAMWKSVPVLTNSRACGPRQQVRDEVDGRLIGDPENPLELSRALDEMLADPARLERWGRSAQRRVHDEFLVLTQVRAWARTLAVMLGRPGNP